MYDRIDGVVGDKAAHERLVGNIALAEDDVIRHNPAEASAQVIQDDDFLTGITEVLDHVAADVAGAAGDE